MQYLMHGVGVFEDSGELVGFDFVSREQAARDFKGVLRMLRESVGERFTHGTVMSAKKSLQALLLMSVVSSSDALSLLSPMHASAFGWFGFQLSGFSLWIFPLMILFCIWCSTLVMMIPQQYHAADEPEPEAGTSTAATPSGQSFNKIAVYGFLTVCVKRCLELLDEAELDENHTMASQLNATYDILIDTHFLFESDGINTGNLRSMMEMHAALQRHDPQFDAFNLISVVRETGFEQDEGETDCESLLPPDPPTDLSHEAPAEPYQPHSPEHMSLWLIEQPSERITRCVQSGRSAKVLQCVEQRQVMVALCKYCDNRPEQRPAVWSMMQSLSDLSKSEDEA